MNSNLDCRQLKKEALLKLKEKIEKEALQPVLAIIQVGSVDASNIYIRNKRKAADEIGITTTLCSFEEDVDQETLLRKIEELNENPNINGIFIQLPIPSHLDEVELINHIDPKKDVDGLTTMNLGNLVSGEPLLTPCTPNAVMDILEALDCDITGKNVTIIGRSRLVGKPLFHLLLQKDATITMCHSKTENLKEHTLNADILITAAGTKKNLITADMVKEDAIIIDVSIIRDEQNQLHGDVDYDTVKEKVNYVTPVPGGVGQLTVLELMKNTVKANEIQKTYTLKKK